MALDDVAPLGLNPRLDAELIARVYRAAGRVHIPDIFDARSAARIHRCLAGETPWRLVLFDGVEHREFEVATLAELPAAERLRLQAAVDDAARHGFSYRYSNFRLFENRQQGLYRESYLMRVLDFLNAAPFRDLMRRITADPAIEFADAQATLYRAGDFLTRHDDSVDGKGRRAAYVLSFTPEWIPDWGGLLAFPDRQGHLSEAYAPAFNALNLFRVPMLHAVTQVSSFAPLGRYSITGWLRQYPAAG
jgi:Rps23 Pro-64 3,4-dihydroxylase Tpa1-like proline 4-hydroxylase